MAVAVDAENNMIFYFAYLVGLGVVLGWTLRLLRSSESTIASSTKWVAYVCGIGATLGLSALIGQYRHTHRVEEWWDYTGAAIVAVLFIGIAFTRRR